MKCPVDNTPLKKRIYEGSVEIDYCETCKGTWLDATELEKIQENLTADHQEELRRIPDYVGKAILMEKTKDNAAICCPKCNEQLERKEYGYCSQVYIDSCINGHGIWLDKDELEELEIFYERSRIEANKMKRGFLKSLLDIFK
jgi:Zn-finger nucleic acid-binding protein